MTKKELLEALAPYPDSAEIYVESDHGQIPAQAGFVAVSKDEQLPYTDFDGDIGWKSAEDVKKNDQVTAINIG